MKNTGLIILLALLLPILGWAQGIGHKAVINSMGGDASVGGNYTNYVIVGQSAQDSILSGGTVQTSVGFLYAADDTFGSTPPCYIPMGFDLTALDPDQSANFTWSAEAGLSYEYRFIDITSDIESASVESAGQVSSLQLTGLASGTGYQIQLRTSCGNGNFSDWTQPLTFETFGLASCLAPQGVSVTIGGNAPTSVTLSWFDEPKDENGGYPQYFVRYRSAEDTDWTIEPVTNPLGVLGNQTYVATNVAAGIYQVQVGKQCAANENPVYGDPLLFEVGSSCTAIEPNFLNATESSISITWSDVGADSYAVRYRRAGTFEWSPVISVPNTNTDYTLSALDDGAVYEIEVKVICSNGESPWGPTLFAETLGNPCEVPQNIDVISVQETSFGISWLATNALYYDIRYRAKGTAAWSSGQTFDTFFFTENLTGNTLYEFEVASICEFGEPGSNYSDRFDVLTEPATVVCDVPTNVNAVPGVNDGEVNISWNDVSVLAYEVRFRRLNSNIWNTRLLVGSNTNILLDNLIEKEFYEYQMRSLCGEAGEVKSTWTTLSTFEVPGQECIIPTVLSATANGTAIDLVFTHVANGYFIRYKPDGFPFWNTIQANGVVNGANYEASLNGLEPGVGYQVSVASTCGPTASSFTTPVSVSIAGAVCEIPFISSITPTIGGVTIDWNDVSSNYRLRYRLKGTTAWTFVETSVSDFATTSLQPGMIYQFQVRSLCSSISLSEYSLIQEFETGGVPACDVPVILSASSTESSINLNWSNASGALYYVVQFRPSGTAFWNTRQVFDLNNPANYSYAITGLQSGTAYQYRIQSVCDENGILKSAFSPVAFIETLGPVACEIPSGLVITTSTSTATLNWPNGTPTFQIRYRKVGDLFWSTSSISPAGLLGLVEATTYEYQIRQVCGIGQYSEFSSIQTFTMDGFPCVMPTINVLSSANDVQVQIIADGQVGSADTELFEYQYRLQGTTAWNLGSVPINNTNVVNAGVVTFNNLLPGEIYQFRARAVCDATTGSSTGYTSLTTFVFPGTAVPCVVPEGLQQTAATTTTATIAWDDFDGPYDLQYQVSGAFSWITISNISSNSIQLNGLQPGTNYRWRVRATCQSGADTEFSPIAFFTTDAAPTLSLFPTDEDPAGEKLALVADDNEIGLPKDYNFVHGESELDESHSLAELSVTTYPNPFRDRLLLRLTNPNDADLSINLFNVAGVQISRIFKGSISANQQYEFTVDGSLLPSGIYLVVFNGLGNQRIVKRVILQR